MSQPRSFLFHDYETFGIHPALDHPCQFAAIRTDSELNPIGKPLQWFCQPPNDYIPKPAACLVTGITPQHAMSKGINEASFIANIHQAFSEAGTCGVGYNSLRFDDEVTRYTLYRNFYEPYGREWQNGNSRWDLIDLVRACYALRPEGIEWYFDEQGLPSFKLERLTEVNGLNHGNAHDALSDVEATIALARLLKKAQPRLFDYYLSLRNKREVFEHIDLLNPAPLVHVSGMFGAAQGCVSWVLPIDWHPTNKNALIVVDLNHDVSPLLELDADALRERMYTRRDQLGEGQLPAAIKLIHCNKSPFIAKAKALSGERAEALGISGTRCRQSMEQLRAHLPELRDKLALVYQDEYQSDPNQRAEASLYQGFIGKSDVQLMEQLRHADPQLISRTMFEFNDPRLNRLILPYKARNYPQYLDESELQQWQTLRRDYLQDQIIIVKPELEQLAMEHAHDAKKSAILQQLFHYIEQL